MPTRAVSRHRKLDFSQQRPDTPHPGANLPEKAILPRCSRPTNVPTSTSIIGVSRSKEARIGVKTLKLRAACGMIEGRWSGVHDLCRRCLCDGDDANVEIDHHILLKRRCKSLTLVNYWRGSSRSRLFTKVRKTFGAYAAIVYLTRKVAF